MCIVESRVFGVESRFWVLSEMLGFTSELAACRGISTILPPQLYTD